MEESKKSFLNRPEGITGMLTIGAIGIAGLYFWGKIVPFLLLMVTNTIYLIGGLLALGGILYVLFDPRLRNLVWFMYQAAMKSITSAFIEMNPIIIMKTYLDHLKDKKAEMWAQIEKLAQQIGVLRRTINTNQTDIERSRLVGKKAIELNNQHETQLAANKIGRLEDSNNKLNNVLIVMEKTLGQLEAMHKNAEFFIIDMESEIKTKENEYKAIKASSNAVKAAKSILNGDKNKKMMYDESLEVLSEDMGKRVGEIEFFMKTSASFIEKMDIQNGIYDEEGYRQLEQMNTKFFTTKVQAEEIPFQPVTQIPSNTTSNISVTKSKYL